MIIDCHIHYFPDNLADKAVVQLSHNSGLEAYTNGSRQDTLKKLDENNVDIAVVLNITKRPNQELKVNDFAIVENCNRLIHLGSVNPYSDDIDKEMERLKTAGIKGIKLHPEYQHFDVDDPIADKIYLKAIELDMLVVFHAGFDIAFPLSDRAHPKRLRAVIDRFPDMRVQFAHFGGMLKWGAVEQYLVGSNAYFDISMCGRYIPIDQAKRIIQNHGIDRMLFGSDCPWENWQTMYDFVDKLELSSVDRNKLYYQNAIKLYNIK